MRTENNSPLVRTDDLVLSKNSFEDVFNPEETGCPYPQIKSHIIAIKINSVMFVLLYFINSG